MPEYTECKGEWGALQIEYLVRMVFQLFITVVLVKLIRAGGKLPNLSFVALLISIVSFIFAVFYYLAITDIYHDYVSRSFLISNSINFAALVHWTTYEIEWRILQIDFLIRTIFLVLITLILVKGLRNNN